MNIKDVKNRSGQSYKEFYEDMLDANSDLQKRIAELEAEKLAQEEQIVDAYVKEEELEKRCAEQKLTIDRIAGLRRMDRTGEFFIEGEDGTVDAYLDTYDWREAIKVVLYEM